MNVGHQHTCPVHGDYLCTFTMQPTCRWPRILDCPECRIAAAKPLPPPDPNPIGTKKPQARSTQQEKIDWLLSHEHLWFQWPNRPPNDDTRWGLIVDYMRQDGLVSDRARSGDIPLNKLVAAARRQRKES
jgi:hypothetical protein